MTRTLEFRGKGKTKDADFETLMLKCRVLDQFDAEVAAEMCTLPEYHNFSSHYDFRRNNYILN